MKKLTTMIVLGTILTIGCGAWASETSQKGYISVSSEASEELNPGVVKLSFAIQTDENDAKIAAEKNKKISEEVISSVKTMVDDKKGESIKTTSYYLSPRYNYKDGSRKLIGYSVSNTLQVVLKDVDKAGTVISTALQNGANSVSGVEFMLEETGNNCNELIAKAARKARERAEKTAASLNTSVTGLKNISTGCSSSSNFNSNFRLMKNASMSDGAFIESAGASMPLEAGKTKLNAYVNADFYVK